MKRNPAILIRRLIVCALAANLVTQPAFASVTDISQLPLAATGGNILPNLLFTLDNSGSMAWDFIPDYVHPATSGTPNNPCMSNSAGSTDCAVGDPPYSAGGEFGSNGVAYDPNFSYLVGIDSTGAPHVNPPSGTLTPTATPNDAYGTIPGNTNVTTSIQDRRYCNSNNVCKRPGQDDTSGNLVSGTDDAGHALSAGQFPYRTNASNSSAVIFGLPEMMSIGTISRTGSAVTITTLEPHGLTTSDKVFVTGTGTASVDLGFVAVASTPTATSFTYTSTASGTLLTGGSGTFTRSGSTVTVTSTAHTLATNDKVDIFTGDPNLDAAGVTVTLISANSFKYTTAGSGAIASTLGTWARQEADYRKYVSGNFVRAGSTVTVTSASHGLVANDIVTTFVATSGPMTVTNVTVATVTANAFTYTTGSSGTIASAAGFWVRTGLYNVAGNVNGPAVAYRIAPVEWCADANLTDCVEVTPPPSVAPSAHPFPAYVRFCRTQGEALAHGAVTFIATTPQTNRCQAKFVLVSGLQPYQFPRYGWFIRDTIKSTVATYSGRPGRVDCAAPPVCTYNEEIQNYAKWWAYYRTRMQMMKTSAGLSFFAFVSAPLATPPKPDKVRVGFITIHVEDSGNLDTNQYLKINNFNTVQAASFYTKFYQQSPGNATPLQEALSRAGWIFAGKLNTGLTKGIPTADDPIQASCQKNYSIMTTDGFWNGNPGQNLAGGAIGNQDNGNPAGTQPFIFTPASVTPLYTDAAVSRATGTYDGNILPAVVAGTTPGGSGTLADVAMYYYMNDLRGGTDRAGIPTGPATSPNTSPPNSDVSLNNVPSKAGHKDFAIHQHMVTYTVGLADGLLLYDPNYETALTGDFANIKNGTSGACFWATGVCNWPVPQANGQSALDDLWHAAVNGRGTFFQALNPRTLANGLRNAITNISTTNGSASAAATSSPNITPTDNFAFSTTFQTNSWSGVVKAQNIDPVSGVVLAPIVWQADTQLLTQVTPTTDSRNIWMLDTTQPTKLKPFLFASMTPAEQAFFTNKCPTMSQCGLLSAPQVALVNTGLPLIGFLRGQTGNEAILFRDRIESDPVTGATLQTVLGDIVDATPAYIRVPEFNYTDTGYSAFKTANLSRAGTLYVAANDGLLHAFDNSPPPAGGLENWAYMPKFVMPGVYQIADTAYASAHRFMLDGSPEIGDVFDATAAVWKTIIVGGADSGARGYYALDITDPRNPKGLWEFCSDSTLCPNTGAISHSDPNLGFTYGNPVIGKLSDGTWVVVLTSGLNNVSPGNGHGFFYVLDAITGKVLSTVDTSVGTTTTPSGLMKHAGFYNAGLVDGTISFMYGGDLLGNFWRLDMRAATKTVAPTLMHMVTLKDGAGNTQPITVRPVATNFHTFRIVYVGTGEYLGNSDVSNTSQQSIYGLKDKDADYGTNIRSANLVVQTLSAGTSRTISTGSINITTTGANAFTTFDGFVIDLNPAGDSPGERIVLDPRLELGTLIFTSNVPIVGGCTPGGESFIYNLDFSTGSFVPGTVNSIAGVRQGSFLVGVTPIQTTDGSIRTINTDSGGGLGTGSVNINKNPKGISRFSYRER